MDQFQAQAIVERRKEQDLANVTMGMIDRNQSVQRHVFDLSTARSEGDPFPINYPFKSFVVEDASDLASYVYMRPVTKEEVQGYTKLGLNSSGSSPIPSKAFFHWPAQPGKTLTLVVFTEIEFKPGSQINQISGGVSINEGSGATNSSVACANGSATSVFAANGSRKCGTLQNRSGQPIYVGGTNAIDATTGILIPDGSSFQWRNTGALYVYQNSGGAINVVIMEET
jgi:hypothetical protein